MKMLNQVTRFKSFGLVSIALGGMALASTASAQLLGVDTARSANVSEYSQYSIEGAVELGEADLFGARAGMNVGNGLAVFGNLGLLGIDGADSELAYGGGVIYEIEQLIEGFDTAITGSFHRVSYDAGYNSDVTFSSLTVRGLVSAPLDVEFNYPLTWYASAGFERLTAKFEACFLGNCANESNSDIEVAFGGGVIADIEQGEVFVGADYVDGFTVTAGYRHSF